MDFICVALVFLLSVPALPSGSPPTATLQTHTENVPPSNETLLAEPTMATTEDKTHKRASTNLSDTTVVIIVSVSLALLVFAMIPLIFYGNWKSNADTQNITTNKGDVEGNSTIGLHRVPSSGIPSTSGLFSASSRQLARATTY
ncbi:uncharacterized protein LOC144077010 [Stigmatopora argus]